MIEVISGIGVWDKLYERLPVGTVREAAIAYIGKGAAEYLLMAGETDVLIFDGCDASIAQNHVDLDEIATLMDAGVSLYSREGLHAKMMLIEGDDETLAVVGSANISQHSVNDLVEAVTVFDDPAAVDQVREALLEYRAGGTLLDDSWLQNARSIPRQKQGPKSKWQIPSASLADPAKPLWLIDYEWSDTLYPTAVTDAVQQVATDTGAVTAASPPLPKKLFDSIKLNDSILFAHWPGTAKSVRRNAPIKEPSVVMRKLEVGRRRWLLVITRQSPTVKPWHEVEHALRGASWQGEFPAEVDELGRSAIFRVYS